MTDVLKYAIDLEFEVVERNLSGEDVLVFRREKFNSGEITAWRRMFTAKKYGVFWEAYFLQAGVTKLLTDTEFKEFLLEFKNNTYVENIKKYV